MIVRSVKETVTFENKYPITILGAGKSDAMFDVGAIDINNCKIIINNDHTLEKIDMIAGTTVDLLLELRLFDNQ